ncbi:L protein [Mammarenavirus praomyidis]|uniref:RNA-directed RNA polymerase L n=1 Tax=Mobala mammarenavirus (isolate Rat/Central African Republic/Acar 3080/1983) TaxID=3052325 RepID=L_MOBVC|nr:L protein [Mammarenavirus praomyidis]Q27YE5.1 RecName: Full=RNA-directed RNA polymerase L; Short=Protein L; AltName: Full=Large structural protein; AltName: Full=Replicase; AltName: Full=Transcriptase; Includes: RecName: Full=cap-snatching endonuclease [Mammarenavirus praomyidis]ABC71139.1 L protein [Mammarenavirus praomyidis]
MEEQISEVKDIISKYLSNDDRLAKQKLAFLVQSEPKLLLIEGLKLLSLCIEIDSCEANGCDHNTKELSVENFLSENRVLCPGLPMVVPDGFKLNGNVLMILECFVRSSPANFEQKYREDLVKLNSLKEDLMTVGITMLPLIDGRTNFQTDRLPEWANERFRTLLFSLLAFSQESSRMFEEAEYSRLCESLNVSGGKRSGIENINILSDHRSEHFDELLKLCHVGINNHMSSLDVKREIIQEFQAFRNKLQNGVIERQFLRVNREELIKAFNEMYTLRVGDKPELLDSLLNDYYHSCPLITMLYCELPNGKSCQSDISHVRGWRSLLNKVKSLRLINTRRKLMLIFDSILLLAHMKDLSVNGHLVESEWMGSSFLSVNDRLVSLPATQKDLKTWLQRRTNRLSHSHQSQSAYEVFSTMVNRVLNKAKEVLLLVNLTFKDYNVDEDILSESSFTEMMSLEVNGVEPTINYEKNPIDRFSYNIQAMDPDNQSDLKRLSSISLALVNSMKTSSTVKLRQNEHGKLRYKCVRCKEAYYQDFLIEGHRLMLIYQKTGECSKCYSVNDAVVGELCSFYADPKRYFPAIFSDSVLQEMIDTMISWLTECSELKEFIKEIKSLLKMVVMVVLTNPTKRIQKFLQNLRYFTMAYVSEYHHKDLLEKLREDLITNCEFLLYRITRSILNIVFNVNVTTMITNRFKFILNLSYLCHLITKETPDRLTDQIKCFEKFIEPKMKFDSVNVNPLEPADQEELRSLLMSADKFLSKPDCFGDEGILFKTPGVSRKIFSMMVSSFNNGSLFKQAELKNGVKDPLVVSGCATALDLASNKSVVVNKYTDGDRIIEYDYDKLVATAVCQLSEVFSRKGKYVLSKEDYDFKIQQIMSDLVIGRSKLHGSEIGLNSCEEVDEVLIEGGAADYFDSIKQSVDTVMSKFSWSGSESSATLKSECSIDDLSLALQDKAQLRLIRNELSCHMVEDFDVMTLPYDTYEEICKSVYSDPSLRSKYFYLESLESCPLTKMAQAVCTRTFHDEEYFQCFKSLLLQMNANKLSGKFNHYKSKCLNFKLDRDRLFNETRISERESNSEALSKALSLTNCTTAALKNLCFYSQESPQSYNSQGPDTGRLKFSLSYKEQVGGNRELYIGDLRTKMFTRLIEDYFEALTSQFKGSCLNDEHEFENAVFSMKFNVSLGLLSYSLDHSKWGPMMTPFLFLATLQNINWPSLDTLSDAKSRDYVSSMLSWHIHKLVEVPFNVVTAMMKSFIKSKLGLKKNLSETMTERFFFEHFRLGKVPSHISSILDKGQGILQNTSDFYGLISERFINYCISCLYEGNVDAFTSSDDQISLFDKSLSDLLEKDPDEFEYILEFHNYLSDQLNKFISPKSVKGNFAAEFKSRFFVWGDEVPLLTKFVAASLHNIKCKEPHQLAETIDTIIDQAVANGVPVKLCNIVQERTLNLLRYAQYPIDPFLMFCSSDVKDWVDGNRGYRIMRNIEMLEPNGTRKVRSFLRRLYNNLKTGLLHEEFTAAYLSGDPYQSLAKLSKIFDTEILNDEELGLSWLNLSAYYPLRMVLRQKVIYTGAVNVEEEKLPTIVKTLQNKLSSNFTRGAQKLLSEAINRSAFQSCIASGFVGLCRTLGSKCVRGPERENFYIKSIMNQSMMMEGVSRELVMGVDVWRVRNPLDNSRAQQKWGNYFRPILWDYLCIALSTALEIGSWVLGEPKLKSPLPQMKFRPCDYFPMKPSVTRLLEDKVGFNHIIHSFRRLYPDIFEKHLLPFMSDLASTKMKWSPRVKFLDLCVMLDVNCEAMSLVSHIVKWKREEHYVILSDELSISHDRSHESLADERVVSTEDVSENFLRQIYFESFARPFVATSRTLGSFTWFPHKTSLPESEGLASLGPFGTFIEKVIFKGIERPMYRHDLFSGYAWLDFDFGEFYINSSKLIQYGLTEMRYFEDLSEFMSMLSSLKPGSIEISLTVNFQVKSQGESLREKFFIHCKFYGSFDVDGKFEFNNIGVQYSGAINRSAVLDCWRLILTNSHFLGDKVIWHLNTANIKDYLKDGSMVGEVVPIEVIINRDALRLDTLDFERVGPDVNVVPLVVKDGYIFEGDKKLVPFNPSIHDQDFEILVKELCIDDKELLKDMIQKMITVRGSQGLQWHSLDIVAVLTKNMPTNYKDFITESLSVLDSWTGFKGYSLCFSKTKNTLMIHTSEGNLRLKGKLCRKLFDDPVHVEDIE